MKKNFLLILIVFIEFFSSTVDEKGLSPARAYATSSPGIAIFDEKGVLINEIRPSGGVGKTTDEFIELYNPGNTTIDLSAWILAKQTKTSVSSSYETIVVFSEQSIKPLGHLLVAHKDYLGNIPADVTYNESGISDNNSILLINESGSIIDLVGYGDAQNFEKTPANSPSGQLLSIERLPGVKYSDRQDTGDNGADFIKISSNPQNSASVVAPIPDDPIVQITTTTVATSTIDSAVLSPIITTVSSSIQENKSEIENPLESESDKLENGPLNESLKTNQEIVNESTIPEPGSILIDEILPIPNSFQEEFVELYNRTPLAISIKNWWIEDGAGSKTYLDGTVNPYSHFLIPKPKGNLNNTGDGVILKAEEGSIIDQMFYGDWEREIPGKNADSPTTGFSLIRSADDFDSNDDSKDFVLTDIVTPGQKNHRQEIRNDDVFSDITTEQTNTAAIREEKVSGQDNTVRYATSSGNLIKSALRVKITADKIVDFYEPAIFDASETTGSGEITYLWDLGDGTVLEGESIDHVYKNDGYFVVTLIVMDTTDRKTKKMKIQVREQPVKKSIPATSTIKLTGEKKISEDTKMPIDNPVFVEIAELGSLKSGALVSVRGIVAAEPDSYKKNEFYIIDKGDPASTGTRVVYQKNTPTVTRGDMVTVTGKYTVKSGENYITLERSDFLVIVDHKEEPKPISVNSTEMEDAETGLVEISGVVTESKKTYAYIDNEIGELKVNTPYGSIPAGSRVSIAGILIKTKGQEILYPRFAGDVILLQEPERAAEKNTFVEPGYNKVKYMIIFSVAVIFTFTFFAWRLFILHKKRLETETAI